MKVRELLGFFGCFALGFACTQTGGDETAGTTAQLCSSNDDCAAAESCELGFWGGVCKPRLVPPAAEGGGSDAAVPRGCSSDAPCGYGQECEYEGGTGYCKPHHGDEHEDGYERDHSDGGGARCDESDHGSGYGEHCDADRDDPERDYDAGAPADRACKSDSECAAGETCKYADDNRGHGSGSSGEGHGGGRDDHSGHGKHGDDGDDYYDTPAPRTGVCQPRPRDGYYGG